MRSLENQLAYWDTRGASKTFTHPINLEWLDRLDTRARILDYGCGYGRLTSVLHDRGFGRIEGVDPAPALIRRARALWPGLAFHVLEQPPALPYPDASLDGVLLFAVLTCVPTDEGQRQIIALSGWATLSRWSVYRVHTRFIPYGADG